MRAHMCLARALDPERPFSTLLPPPQISINTWVAPTLRLDMPKALADEVVATMKPLLEEWTGALLEWWIAARRSLVFVDGSQSHRSVGKLTDPAHVVTTRRHRGAGADRHQRHPHLPPRGHHSGTALIARYPLVGLDWPPTHIRSTDWLAPTIITRWDNRSTSTWPTPT